MQDEENNEKEFFRRYVRFGEVGLRQNATFMQTLPMLYMAASLMTTAKPHLTAGIQSLFQFHLLMPTEWI